MDTDRLDSDRSRLTFRTNPNRVRAMFAGHVVADTDGGVIAEGLSEGPMHFFPRKDVETGYLAKTHDTTFHERFGEGVFYTWVMEGEIAERAVCSFESPPEAAEAIRGYFAFDRSRFEVYELSAEDLAAAPRAANPHGQTV